MEFILNKGFLCVIREYGIIINSVVWPADQSPRPSCIIDVQKVNIATNQVLSIRHLKGLFYGRHLKGQYHGRVGSEYEI
jgi:hypothetical protein